MKIEKEYILEVDDYINFQQYFLDKNSKRYKSYQLWLILYLLSVCILFFSLFYILNNIIKITGLIISIYMIFYCTYSLLFSKKTNKRYWKNELYKNYIANKSKIEITENSIIEYCIDSELRIKPQWVYEFIEIKNYIYLKDTKNYVIILPKKYYSNEDIELIRKYYGEKLSKNNTKQNGT